MKVLVTGAGGFLGGRLMTLLNQSSFVDKVVGTSRKAMDYPWDIREDDLTQLVNVDVALESQVASLMCRYKPDVVFHFAANPLVREQGTVQTSTNVLSTHSLLKHCQPGTRFVLASSATVYGNKARQYVNEDNPPAPNSVYGATKVAAEMLVDAYTRMDLVSGLSLRYVACVGKGATHGLVPDLIRKLKSVSPTLDLLGDEPGSTKPYLHADDAVNAALMFGLIRDMGGWLVEVPVNIVPNDCLTVEEVAKVVMETLDIHKPVRWLGEGVNWAGDNRSVHIDNGRASLLGFVPKYTQSAEAVRAAVREMEGL